MNTTAILMALTINMSDDYNTLCTIKKSRLLKWF